MAILEMGHEFGGTLLDIFVSRNAATLATH
jgi:hypothetical protein